MLTKDLCKLCWNEACVFMEGDGDAWDDCAEEQWNIGLIHCPGGSALEFVDSKPPERCGFVLEHVMNGAGNVEISEAEKKRINAEFGNWMKRRIAKPKRQRKSKC